MKHKKINFLCYIIMPRNRYITPIFRRRAHALSMLNRARAAKRIQRMFRERKARRRILNNNSYYRTYLHEVDTVDAGAGGQVLDRFNDNPVNAAKWNNWATIYGAYRVKSVKIHYMPEDYSDLAAGEHHAYLLVAIDQEDNTVPVNEDDVLQLPNCRMKPSYQQWYVRWYLNRVGNKKDWIETDAPVATESSCKIATDAIFGAAQRVGHVMITYEVEFKGIRNN